MLWSATVTKAKPYALALPFNVRITQACLGGDVKEGKRYFLLCTYENLLEEGDEDTTATVCSLSAGTHENRSLDLCIDGGEEVVFATGGEATIHLTGYMMPDEDDFDSDYDSDSDSDSDDESESGINTVLEALARAEDSSEEESDEEQEEERRVKDVTNGDDSEESESDDSDDEMEDLGSSSGEDVQEYDDMDKNLADSILKKVRAKAERIAQEGKQQAAEKKLTGQKRKASSPAAEQPAKKQKVATPTKKEPAKPALPAKRTLAGGLVVETVREGRGDQGAKRGRSVTVKYSGRLKNGKQFDKGVFSFRVGAGEVIKGWDLGVPGMKVGEKRKLIIPPKLGYGKAGSGPIPKNATLYFDVEMLKL